VSDGIDKTQSFCREAEEGRGPPEEDMFKADDIPAVQVLGTKDKRPYRVSSLVSVPPP
jgi:hypothetical protein